MHISGRSVLDVETVITDLEQWEGGDVGWVRRAWECRGGRGWMVDCGLKGGRRKDEGGLG